MSRLSLLKKVVFMLIETERRYHRFHILKKTGCKNFDI